MSLIHAIRKGDVSSDRTRHNRIRKLFTKEFVDKDLDTNRLTLYLLKD